MEGLQKKICTSTLGATKREPQEPFSTRSPSISMTAPKRDLALLRILESSNAASGHYLAHQLCRGSHALRAGSSLSTRLLPAQIQLPWHGSTANWISTELIYNIVFSATHFSSLDTMFGPCSNSINKGGGTHLSLGSLFHCELILLTKNQPLPRHRLPRLN